VEATCKILEIGLMDNEPTVRFDLPSGMIPAAGQYILAAGLGKEEILPAALFLSNQADQGGFLCGDFPTGWTPGDYAFLRGPMGKGFHVPANLRRLGIISLTGRFSRLLPVIHTALARNAAVSLFSERLPASMPAEVEVLPLEGLDGSWSWADYFAVEASQGQFPDVRTLLKLGNHARVPCPAEILIYTSFPCGGIADCGVCAVKVGGRYRLACKDGPVFDLNSLVF